MKKILGLDLGTNSIGWAVVNEAENDNEQSSIIRLGVRVNPLTVDEQQNFEKGKSITTNAERTLKRSMRRNLQRYKLRRAELLKLLKESGLINDETILCEQGSRTTFETYRLRAKAAIEEISLEELARVLLMINKKRGYKSNRKAKGEEDGSLIDGMDVAKRLYDKDLTPGQLCLQLIEEGKKIMPDFYQSDLKAEFRKIWEAQKRYYPMFTDELLQKVTGKKKTQTWAILRDHFSWKEECEEWNEEQGRNETVTKERKLAGLKRIVRGAELAKENYLWRARALSEKMDPELTAIALQEINGQIGATSGYLGAISDRSKSLYFNNQTVGQHLMRLLQENPNTSLRNRVFYRQDYLDEFNTIWDKQAEFHPELTAELKREFRDVVIFYQRRLKSQKGLISVCEFENRQITIEKNGKTKTKIVGCRVIPRSHPVFQEFKIWQTLNDIELLADGETVKKGRKSKQLTLLDNTEDALLSTGRRHLTLKEKQMLAKELSVKESLKKSEALKLLFGNQEGIDMNFKQISGDKTGSVLCSAFSRIMEASGHEPLDFKRPATEIKEQLENVFSMFGWNKEVLSFKPSADARDMEKQAYFRLWHLLYSFESDNSATGNSKLIEKIMSICNMEREYASILSNVAFEEDYGSLSLKAISKILPYMKKGMQYDQACAEAGYRHSKSSLTREEIQDKVLKDRLDNLPKNSLRNPVVEKILNQMVNVVNSIIDTYGRPDEIRVELARELKKSIKEREEASKSISQNTKENEEIRKILQDPAGDFRLWHVTRADIIRYRLYEELAPVGYKTLYSNQHIPKEKLFSKEIDIEHIIPQARLFDDSMSNKTLEYKSVNIDKGNATAYDYVKGKYGETGLQEYVNRCETLFKGRNEKKSKLKKLLMTERDIPEGFIDRDLRNTQYIAKKTLQMLSEICRRVVATTGSITDELRSDWQLVDVMKELNLPKYKMLGLTETYEDRDGRTITKIKDWTKRNDHRHHAMDALTIAFSKDAYIQYYNNKNAAWQSGDKEHANIIAIKNKYFANGKALPPMPLDLFRAEAKKQLESLIVSIKAKNKVVTRNQNTIKTGKGELKKTQLTPRGQLHKETIYGHQERYVAKEEKVDAKFDAAKIAAVCSPACRKALSERLLAFGGDPKKAFTGKNSLEKNPVYTDAAHSKMVPERVKVFHVEEMYTIRKEVSKDLDIGKVVDEQIRRVLEQRLKEYGGSKADAFSNLEQNPIWLNKEKGICVKRVTIKGINTATALHDKKDLYGKPMAGKDGKNIPNDFVSLGNNHHVAVYQLPELDCQGLPARDESGNIVYKDKIDEVTVSFFEAVARAGQGLPVIDKDYKSAEGWKFLFSMKQNEYFVFPDESEDFDPAETDLLDLDNRALISRHLYRVQKIARKNYMFRHHLETSIVNNNATRGIIWKLVTSSTGLKGIVKVRVDHIGQIVSVGEY